MAETDAFDGGPFENGSCRQHTHEAQKEDALVTKKSNVSFASISTCTSASTFSALSGSLSLDSLAAGSAISQAKGSLDSVAADSLIAEMDLIEEIETESAKPDVVLKVGEVYTFTAGVEGGLHRWSLKKNTDERVARVEKNIVPIRAVDGQNIAPGSFNYFAVFSVKAIRFGCTCVTVVEYPQEGQLEASETRTITFQVTARSAEVIESDSAALESPTEAEAVAKKEHHEFCVARLMRNNGA